MFFSKKNSEFFFIKSDKSFGKSDNYLVKNEKKFYSVGSNLSSGQIIKFRVCVGVVNKSCLVVECLPKILTFLRVCAELINFRHQEPYSQTNLRELN